MPEVFCTPPVDRKGPCSGTGTLEMAMTHVENTYPNDSFTVPMWGQNLSAGIKNYGYVIGFRSSRQPKRYWRLDYDPDKGMHINFEDHSVTPSTKICHLITVLTPVRHGRFPNPEATPEQNLCAIWGSWTEQNLTRPPDPRDVETNSERQKRSWEENFRSDTGMEWSDFRSKVMEIGRGEWPFSSVWKPYA